MTIKKILNGLKTPLPPGDITFVQNQRILQVLQMTKDLPPRKVKQKK